MCISASRNGEVRDVDGLLAFACEDKAHIFFVRISDLESAKRKAPNQGSDANQE